MNTSPLMNITLTPAEVTTIADQISTCVLTRINAALQQASKTQRPSLIQLTVKEVAEQLKFSEKTIHKYLSTGRLRGCNLGTLDKPIWRVSQQNVDDFLKS